MPCRRIEPLPGFTPTIGRLVDMLGYARETLLAAVAERDDAWLEASLAAAPEKNAHWAWFHVCEDEISHRGQIRWLRARVPARPDAEP